MQQILGVGPKSAQVHLASKCEKNFVKGLMLLVIAAGFG
jgi:hypothetical protein